MCSAIVYSCLVALKTPHTWSAHCVHHSHCRSDPEETLLRSLLTSQWTDKHKCTLDPVWCEPLKEMLPCHRLNLAFLQLCLLSLVSFTDSRSLKCSPGKVCSYRPPVVLSKFFYYRTSFFLLQCPVAFLLSTQDSCLLVLWCTVIWSVSQNLVSRLHRQHIRCPDSSKCYLDSVCMNIRFCYIIQTLLQDVQ